MAEPTGKAPKDASSSKMPKDSPTSKTSMDSSSSAPDPLSQAVGKIMDMDSITHTDLVKNMDNLMSQLKNERDRRKEDPLFDKELVQDMETNIDMIQKKWDSAQKNWHKVQQNKGTIQ